MAISVPPRGIGSSLGNRQARPLTGIEVREAIEKHVLTLTEKLLSNQGLLSDNIIELLDPTRVAISESLARVNPLQKVNITYPKVGWSIKIRLEETDHMRWVSGEIELDLQRNVRIPIRFGPSGGGVIVASLEEEKIPTAVPDKDRNSFGLPIEAEYVKPDGTVGKVDIRELKGEKRAARSVDVGRARVEGQEVSQGEPIKLPSELPEVTFDDVVATPPEPPREPLKEPLPPPKSMAQVKRPDVKFKR